MNDKIFFDSNIYVYSVDNNNPEKMKIAQNQFAKGYERKEYVMNMLLDLATRANYPLEEEDIAKISNMIDEMCDMANVVGVKS